MKSLLSKPSWLLQLVLSVVAVVGQGIGTADAPPRLVTEKCTAQGGCVRQNTSLVLDASFHGLRARESDGDGSCGGGRDGGTLCPDAETCARNCVLDGADYEGNGVLTDGSGVVLRQYMRRGENGTEVERVSPRVYLLEEEGGTGERNYEMLYLKSQEISFDVDVSKLVCGMNGALYLAEMNATGARGELNPAGARYGTGYCDAQCPKLPFINGANIESRGSCCTEMDLWEANAFAAAFTGHTCSEPGQYACAGGECGALGVCSKSGCEYNTYRLGNKTFYGGGGDATVDTTRPFTVTTQFLTNTGDAAAGAILNEIRRLYVQDGRVIANAAVADPYMPPGDSIKMSHCQASVAGTFENLGGLRQMGQALDRGMVLVGRIWNDDAAFMNWLDAGDAGPCSATEGDPRLIAENHADTQVAFSNIRWGDLGSTYTAAQAISLPQARRGGGIQ
ncbi:family 7 glycosyl hydrolase [Biscogniauxia mediterranea]|nr:family 7 glycosyl hydrolase [Biscogniauxia mediterranea]